MAADVGSGTSPSDTSPAIDHGTAEDRALVAAILRKDRKATARFVETYTDCVYAYVRHRLAPRVDLVDDIVQDVFLAALGNFSSFLGNAPLRSWLLGIARHKVEGYYRQRLREPEPLADTLVESATDGVLIDEVIDRERLETLDRFATVRVPSLLSIRRSTGVRVLLGSVVIVAAGAAAVTLFYEPIRLTVGRSVVFRSSGILRPMIVVALFGILAGDHRHPSHHRGDHRGQHAAVASVSRCAAAVGGRAAPDADGERMSDAGRGAPECRPRTVSG